MTARAISELANWDGRLDQQRQNAKWRRTSSNLARDPYRAPLENQPLEIFEHSDKFSSVEHVEQSAFCSNAKCHSLATSSANARPTSRADTTSTPFHESHYYRQPSSIAHTAPSPASRSPVLFTPPRSSHLTPNSSVHVLRVQNPHPITSRERTVPLQPPSVSETEVIDLTLEDTEDELLVNDMLVLGHTKLKDKCAGPGIHHRSLSSRHSSPIALEQSLFTPPPPSGRHSRLVMDFIAVPSFPGGLTRADYQPILEHSVAPLTDLTVTDTSGDSSLARHFIRPEGTPRKRKSKERELDVSPRKRCEERSVTMIPGELLDTIYEHTVIPIYDDDIYPPLTSLDLAINTRFQFAYAWREHASKLREAELECMFNFKVLGKACIWARTVSASPPRIPGTAGYVSSEQLRPWQLVLPESSPQGKCADLILDEQMHVDCHAVLEAQANDSSSQEDPLPDGPSVTTVSPIPNSPAFRDITTVDVADDMHQYFNGLGDSPAKHLPSHQRLALTHTFRSQMLQSARDAQISSLRSGFPPLELSSRLSHIGGRECFLGMPPSPPVDVDSSAISGLISDTSFEPAYSPTSPSNVFDASPTDIWSFEQGDDSLLDNDTPPSSHITPTALGTIDPSLLGLEQCQEPSQAPDNLVPKSQPKQSKLPQPVIYMRRPIDPSSMPSFSGKRSVQIKYRDSGEPQASLNLGDPIEQTDNDADVPRVRRHSAPSRNLREYHTSDSDYLPETSTSKIKLKTKRSSLKDKEAAVEHQGTVPSMTSCHQCRNTTVRPKMSCSNVVHGRVCGKRFCNRCILYRYPDVTFDQNSAGFLCPVCTNTCNCSVCSRNRGEEFISMRLGGFAASLFKTRVTLVRDVKNTLHDAHSPPSNVDKRRSASAVTTPTPEPGALPTQPQFWAHVYGMEGERVGSAFMTREHMERLQTCGPSPPPLLPRQPKKARQSTECDKKCGKTRRPRIFIGQPLASWKIRAVRDFEPSVATGTIQVKERWTKAGTRRPRCYIGNPATLDESYGRMPGSTPSLTPSSSRCSTPVLGSAGSLTPLSELEADDYNWPQPDVGECCSWVPPGLLVGSVALDGSGQASLMDPPGAVGTRQNLVQPTDMGPAAEINMNSEVLASTVLPDDEMKRVIRLALGALVETND